MNTKIINGFNLEGIEFLAEKLTDASKDDRLFIPKEADTYTLYDDTQIFIEQLADFCKLSIPVGKNTIGYWMAKFREINTSLERYTRTIFSKSVTFSIYFKNEKIF